MANDVIDGEFSVVESSPKSNQERAIAEYSTLVSDAMIAEYREKFTDLLADTKEGYEEVRKAIAVCRTTRTSVEKKRKELNEDAQSYIRIVNGEAKRLTAEIESIEEPLKSKKQKVDDEQARLKAEAEAAKVKKINDRLTTFLTEAGSTCSVQEAETWTDEQFESALGVAREAYQARLKAEQEAEAERQQIEAERQETLRKQQEEIDRQRAEIERIRAEQQAEMDRLRAEQDAARLKHEAELAQLRAEQAERDRIEQEKIQAEREALQAEKDRIEAEEAAKLEAARQAEEAARIAEEQRQAAERAEQHRIEEEKRLEALKPDLEKVVAFRVAMRAAIDSVERPEFNSDSIKLWVELLVKELHRVASQNPVLE